MGLYQPTIFAKSQNKGLFYIVKIKKFTNLMTQYLYVCYFKFTYCEPMCRFVIFALHFPYARERQELILAHML
jgi:hypothetical protein